VWLSARIIVEEFSTYVVMHVVENYESKSSIKLVIRWNLNTCRRAYINSADHGLSILDGLLHLVASITVI
jgi:hypothetical protein